MCFGKNVKIFGLGLSLALGFVFEMPSSDSLEGWKMASGHSCAMLSLRYSVLQLGTNTAVASSHVRLLGVDISSDLSLDHHVYRICAGCYYRLHQL